MSATHRDRLQRLGLLASSSENALYPTDVCQSSKNTEDYLATVLEKISIGASEECKKDPLERRKCLCDSIDEQLYEIDIEDDSAMANKTLTAQKVLPPQSCNSSRYGPRDELVRQTAKYLRFTNTRKKDRETLCNDIYLRLTQAASLIEARAEQRERESKAKARRRWIASDSSESSEEAALTPEQEAQLVFLKKCASEMHRYIEEQLIVPENGWTSAKTTFDALQAQQVTNLEQWRSLNATLRRIIDETNAKTRRQELPDFVKEQMRTLDSAFQQGPMQFRLPTIESDDVPTDELLGYLKRASRVETTERDDETFASARDLFMAIDTQNETDLSANVVDFYKLMQMLYQDPQRFVQFSKKRIDVFTLGKIAVRTGLPTVEGLTEQDIVAAAQDFNSKLMQAHVRGTAKKTPYLSFAGSGGLYGVLPVAVHLWRYLEQARRENKRQVYSYVVSLDRGEGFFAPAVAAMLPPNAFRTRKSGAIEVKGPTMLEYFAASDDEYLSIRSVPAQSLLRILRFDLRDDGFVSVNLLQANEFANLEPAVEFDACLHAKLFNIYDLVLYKYYAMREQSKRFRKFSDPNSPMRQRLRLSQMPFADTSTSASSSAVEEDTEDSAFPSPAVLSKRRRSGDEEDRKRSRT